MNNPILSICIPTYNRSNYLNDTLNSITTQKRFRETNEVEIVISDNCSEDNTADIVSKYAEKYFGKIRYYRNNENIVDANFERALSYGRGSFLKLNNDTLKHEYNTLDILIDIITNNIDKQCVIFLPNKNITLNYPMICKDLNSFVKVVSYYSTWIGAFGIWKKDFDEITDFNRKSHLRLTQTDILFRLISKKKFVYIDNRKIFNSIELKNKGGYNLYEVFVTNYLSILRSYLESKQIDWSTWFWEKHKLMIKFIIPWSVNILVYKHSYSFSYKNSFKIVYKEYSSHPVFYVGMMYFPIIVVLKYLYSFFKKIV